jgi:hypothetical protein
MKQAKKLSLSRETLRYLSAPEDLRHVAAGATTPVSVCVDTCPKLCNPTGPPACSARAVCGQ